MDKLLQDIIDEIYQQGREDAIKNSMELHNLLQDIVYAQSMINRSVYRLNKIICADKGAKDE